MATLWIRVIISCIAITSLGVVSTIDAASSPGIPRRVLVFGGNGFLGASTVEALIQNGDDVTIVNRGNWYWDSKYRIKPHVNFISCDRQGSLDKCEKLVNLVKDGEEFDAVVDFSAYGPKEVAASSQLLQDKAKRYILISTDSVYEVCADKTHRGPSKETDAVRPEDEEERSHLSNYHPYGNKKLQAEEELIKQRLEGGIPFVNLRLPDVVGPRDTTYRWWTYQLWIKLTERIPTKAAKIPFFLDGYTMSLVFVDDVANAISHIVGMGPEVNDQAINLAYPEAFTMDDFMKAIRDELNMDFDLQIEDNRSNAKYLYPSVRRGPLDVTKAQSLIGWKVTPWAQVVADTVKFYESATKEDDAFPIQRDEIIHVVSLQFYSDMINEFYEAVEEAYGINLHHFKQPRDEL